MHCYIDNEFDDISPELDMMISQKASQVVKEAPQMEAIKSITNLGQQQQQQNPLQFAQQLAQLEAQMLQMKTQAELQISAAKAQQDMAIKDAEAKQDMAIDQAKLNADLTAKMKKLEADIEILRQKNLAKQINQGV